jgi:hypothetical protein
VSEFVSVLFDFDCEDAEAEAEVPSVVFLACRVTVKKKKSQRSALVSMSDRTSPVLGH